MSDICRAPSWLRCDNAATMRAPVAAVIALSAALATVACAGGSSGDPSPGPTASIAPSKSPRAAVSGCEGGPDGSPRVVLHGEGLDSLGPAISKALAKASERSDSAYGYRPSTSICAHVFPGDREFIRGLHDQGGFDRATAATYEKFLGTFGRDIATGNDAIFINAILPQRVVFIAVHEYFHVVQSHLPRPVGVPTWFEEGIADWEAQKIEPHPQTNWLALLVSSQRAGSAPSLSSLATWDQWRTTVAQGNPANPSAGYHKARAAAMFLEETDGEGAASEILHSGATTLFEEAFRAVTGLGLAEFESRLEAFLLAPGTGSQ